MDPRIIGALLNSALYLSFVAWVGIMTGHHRAVYLAIAAMGVTYLGYVAQISLPESQKVYAPVIGISIALGLAAGVSLLV